MCIQAAFTKTAAGLARAGQSGFIARKKVEESERMVGPELMV
jgi:hypothetical protein